MDVLKINGGEKLGRHPEQDEFFEEEIVQEEDIYTKIDDIINAMDADGVSGVPVRIKKWANDQWEQVTETTADSLPTSHDIGIKYGAGKYRIQFIWRSPLKKKGNIFKKVEFSLNEVYDDLKAENDRKNRPKNSDVLHPTAIIQNQNNDNIMMMMLKQSQDESRRLHELVLKMVENKPQETSSDLQKFYLEDISNTRRLQIENSQEAFRMGLKLAQDTSIKENESSEILQIINVLAENAPNIISAFTPKTLVRKRIMQNPGAEEFLNNPAKVRQVYEGLKERVGPEVAAKVAEKADIKLDGVIPSNEIKIKVV